MIRVGHGLLAALLLTAIWSPAALAQTNLRPPANLRPTPRDGGWAGDGGGLSASASVEYPKWDAGAGWGLVFTNRRDRQLFDPTDGPSYSLNADLGRYFTPHIRADVGVAWSPTHFSDVRAVPIPGLPPDLFFLQWTPVRAQPTTVSAAATYQFRDNEFMHPFVSGGVRTIIQAIRTDRDETTLTIRGVRYNVPGFHERDTAIVVRPFVAVGCKSYFNRWVYVRSELTAALGPAGFSHVNVRIATGFDF